MSEIEAAIKRHKKRAYNIYEEEKDDRKISQIFSKILISIIIILICTIYIKLSPDNLSAFKSSTTLSPILFEFNCFSIHSHKS